MTEEQIKALIAEALKGEAMTAALGELVKSDDFKTAINGAIKGHVGQAIKDLKLSEQVTSAVTEAVKGLQSGDGGTGTGNDDGDKGDGKPSADMIKLQREMEGLKTKLASEQSAREEAEAARKTDRLLGSARDALAKAGVPSERVHHAIALLHHANGVLKFDDSDRAGVHFDRDGYTEVVPMDKGIVEWLKTADGKAFLPPTDQRGSGGREGNGNPGGGGKATNADDLLGTVLSLVG